MSKIHSVEFPSTVNKSSKWNSKLIGVTLLKIYFNCNISTLRTDHIAIYNLSPPPLLFLGWFVHCSLCWCATLMCFCKLCRWIKSLHVSLQSNGVLHNLCCQNEISSAPIRGLCIWVCTVYLLMAEWALVRLLPGVDLPVPEEAAGVGQHHAALLAILAFSRTWKSHWEISTPQHWRLSFLNVLPGMMYIGNWFRVSRTLGGYNGPVSLLPPRTRRGLRALCVAPATRFQARAPPTHRDPAHNGSLASLLTLGNINLKDLKIMAFNKHAVCLR